MTLQKARRSCRLAQEVDVSTTDLRKAKKTKKKKEEEARLIESSRQRRVFAQMPVPRSGDAICCVQSAACRFGFTIDEASIALTLLTLKRRQLEAEESQKLEVTTAGEYLFQSGLPLQCSEVDTALANGPGEGLFRPDPLPSMTCKVLFEKFGTPAVVLENVLSSAECKALVAATDAPKGDSDDDAIDGAGSFVAASVDRTYRNCTRREVFSPALSKLVWSRVGGVLSGMRGIRQVDVGDVEAERREGKLDPRYRLPKKGCWRLRGSDPAHDEHGPTAESGTPDSSRSPSSPQPPVLPLNDVWRFCKYEPGGHFSPHVDGYMRASDDERSFFTFMLYLTDESAGTTNFMAGPGAFEQLIERDAAAGFSRSLVSSTLPTQPRIASAADITHTVRPKQGLLLCFWHFIPHKGGQTIAESASTEPNATDSSAAAGIRDPKLDKWVEAEMRRCKYILRSDLWYCRNGAKPLGPFGANLAPKQLQALRYLGQVKLC